MSALGSAMRWSMVTALMLWSSASARAMFARTPSPRAPNSGCAQAYADIAAAYRLQRV